MTTLNGGGENQGYLESFEQRAARGRFFDDDLVPSLGEQFEPKIVFEPKKLSPIQGRIIQGRIAIIDERVFLAECLKRCLRLRFYVSIDSYPTISAMIDDCADQLPKLILMSIDSITKSNVKTAINTATRLAPGVPIAVLSYALELDTAREVLDCGVKGYIPMTMGFEIGMEAVRFVFRGGTYIPPECMSSGYPEPPRSLRESLPEITARQRAVIQAIQLGKSNKVIAFELDVCESTVKVHIRNIMKKLKVKNRTELAVKSAEWVASSTSCGTLRSWTPGTGSAAPCGGRSALIAGCSAGSTAAGR
jgi:DNA-binding NarL/FixJ family response regulator